MVAEEGRLNKDIRSKEAVKSGITFDGSQVLYGKLRPYLHNWLNPDFKGVAVGDWWVLKPINVDKNFLYRLIQTQQFDNIANQSSGSKMPRADWNLISNSEFMVPLSKKEQSKIGRYFDNLDHLITLHHRKCVVLRKMKVNDWEQRKLGEIAPLRGGYAFQSNNFLEEGIPIVKISNILSTGEVAGEFSFYEELDNDTNFILPDKAAVLAMSGATTGKVSILSNPSNIKFYQNQRVGYFKKTDGINYPFISTLVRSQVFNNQLNSILVTGAQPNVSSKDIDDFDVLIPTSYKEQKKIGAYFSNLDHLITLHHRECVILRKMKVNDWEQRKLNEVAEFNPKSDLPESFEYVDLESVVGTEMVSHRTESKETAPSRAQRLAQTGDVFFQTVRPYQRNNYLQSLIITMFSLLGMRI